MVDYWSCNISNMRGSVSLGYPNTDKRVENTTHSGVFLKKLGVWITNKMLSRVFDVSETKPKD